MIKKVILTGQEVLQIIQHYVADREAPPGYRLDMGLAAYGKYDKSGREYSPPVDETQPLNKEDQLAAVFLKAYTRNKSDAQKLLENMTVEVTIYGASPSAGSNGPDPVHGDNVAAPTGSV